MTILVTVILRLEIFTLGDEIDFLAFGRGVYSKRRFFDRAFKRRGRFFEVIQ